MEFFKTDEGLLHGGRIVGSFYVIALVGGCLLFDEFDRLCAARVGFAAGWWLVLGGKHPVRTWSEIMARPIPMMGTTLAVLGIVGQFYFTWARNHPRLMSDWDGSIWIFSRLMTAGFTGAA